MIGLCAICANDRDGAIREHDGRRVFVCDRCESEHPREGGYSFEPGESSSEGCYRPGMGGRVGMSWRSGVRNTGSRR